MSSDLLLMKVKELMRWAESRLELKLVMEPSSVPVEGLPMALARQLWYWQRCPCQN